VARIGGDEFVMLCQDLNREDEVLGIARRVAETLAAPVQLGELEVVTTASIGIAMAVGDGDLPAVLLGNADSALHRAKQAGGDCFEVFDQAMRVRTMARLALENELRTGIERGELHLVYQVQVELATGRIRGVEALVRWEHRERGQLAPGDFLPIAEASGLIVPLGRWVLEEACAQAARWRDLAGGTAPMMSVNVSARQLAQRDFAEQVAAALASSGLPSTELCLEITEGTLLDTEHTPPTCEALVASGVRLAIDDFGTGFSSLSYLKRLDVSSIKIDQSFVRGLTPTDTAIVEASVRLADSLQLGSVAEGVETEGHAAYLRSCGCQLGQGFYFNQPDPAQAVGELIAHRPFETSR
jgi:EAL domain-containing protein (putative c-di-GMP-specific phosphodiesterase class I)